MKSEEIRVLSPTAILGYGYPQDSLKRGMEQAPHVIAVDGGSTDAGPYFLGMGPENAAELAGFKEVLTRDLGPLLEYAVERDIPLIIGSAGGAGGNLHLMATAIHIRKMAEVRGLHFPMALIPAELDKGLVKQKLEENKVTPLGPAPPLSPDSIDRSVRVVAQMGTGPFVSALQKGARVIVAGRASDPAMFAALPIYHGHDTGLALHLGKILECGAIAAEPGSGGDVLMGTIRDDHFIVEPASPDRRCTVRSVASHSLYEASDPWNLEEPGGTVSLAGVSFEQETERSVRVSGSRFVPSPVYKLKLEGAEAIGFRTICVAGARDPSVIANLAHVLEEARRRTAENFGPPEEVGWDVHFRVYGRDGVMGRLEPSPQAGHEVGIFMEVIAPSQEQATGICMFVHACILHQGFPGRTSTAGNLAFPMSPQDVPAGRVHRFNVYHLMEIEDPAPLFPVKIVEV